MKKTWKKAISGVLVAALCICGLSRAPEQAEAKKKASLKTKTIKVQKGKSKRIVIKNKNKKCRYTFTSNKKKIATVSKKGVVKGKKKGTAKITVKEISKKGKKRKLGKVKVKVTVKKVTNDNKTQNTNNNSGTSNVGSTATATPTNVPNTPPATAPATSTATATATQGTQKPTKVPLPTDLPAELVSPKATTAPGTLAVADKPLMYSDIPDLDYIRVGDDYYMVSTTMFLNPGVPIMHSTDLVHWEIISYVYDTMEDNDTTNLLNGKQCYGKGSWAASLRYNENEKLYYVCFSSNDQSKFYIYTTDDITSGNWKKHTSNGLRHDPGLLFDGDKKYIFSGNGNISMQEFTLTEDGIKNIGSAKTVIKKASSSNIVSIEGAHAYKIGEYYYLFFIEWPKNGQRMEWCYRTKSLTDQWEGRVVFCSEGIAQGGILDTKYGDWYGLLFKDNGAVGRTPVLLEVYWVDGWPVMGSNGGKASAMDGMKVNLTSNGKSYIYADDDFNYTENKLQLVWQWNHNPDNANWSVTEREGYLRLKTGTKADTIMNARNSLTQRTYGPTCTSEVGIDVSNMKDGDYAGICAFANLYGQVGVMKEGGKTYLYYGTATGNKEMTVSDANKVELKQSEVKLKISYDFTKSKASFAYSLDGTEWTTIGGNLSMVYDLTVFMGYRTYLYNYATKETGGYVDFDYYKIY